MHDLWPKVVEETKTRTHLSYVHGKGEKQHKPVTILNVITNCVLPSFFYKKDTEATICDTEVHWNSRLQMVMHSLKGNSCKKIYLCS